MASDMKFCLVNITIACILLSMVQVEGLPYIGYDPYTARDSQLNNYLKSVLDPLKKKMRTGMPQYGLPVLDPLVMSNISKSYSSDKANASIFVQDPTITGLSNFTLHKLDAHLGNLTVDIKVVFPKITVTSERYQLSGIAGNIIPLIGDGKVDIQVNNVEIDVSVKFSIPSSGNVRIDDIRLDVDFENISVFLEELMGGGSLGDFINAFISSRGKKYYLMYKPQLMEKASILAKQKANKALSKLKLGKLNLK